MAAKIGPQPVVRTTSAAELENCLLVNPVGVAEAGWQLSDAEQETLLLEWIRQSVPHVESIEERFRQACDAACDHSTGMIEPKRT